MIASKHVFCLIVIAWAASSAFIQAATYTWSSADTTGNWSSTNTGTDWKSAAFPNLAGSIAQYSATAGAGQALLDVSATVGQLKNANTSAFTLASSGSHVLTLDNGGGASNPDGNTNAYLGATSSGGLTVSPDISMATDLDIGIGGSGSVSVNGGITNGTGAALNLTFRGSGTGTLTLAGNIGATGSGLALLNNRGTGNGTVISGSLGANVVSIEENSTSSSLNLTGNNANYVGTTTLTAGALGLNNANALGGGTLVITGGTLSSTAASGLTLATVNTEYWNGDFSAKSTAGLNLGTGGVVLGGTRSVTIVSGLITVGGVVSDGGSGYGLNKAGSGILALAGADTYGGATTVVAGTLNLLNSLALQNSTLSSGGIVFDSAVGSHAFTFGGLTGSGNIALADNAGTPHAVALSVGNNNSSPAAYSGILSGAGSLTKVGSGVQIVSGANTFSGGTTVSSGKLLVANATGSATGTGGLSVARGASFGGSGRAITSRFDIGSGTSGVATVQVGSGTDATSSLTLQGTASTGTPNTISNSNLTFVLDSTSTQGSQLLVADSAINFSSVTLMLSLLGGGSIASDTAYALIVGTGGTGSGAGQYSGLTLSGVDNRISGLAFSFADPAAAAAYSASYLFLTNNADGTDTISLEVVPEPATWAMLLGGLGLCSWKRRKARALPHAFHAA